MGSEEGRRRRRRGVERQHANDCRDRDGTAATEIDAAQTVRWRLVMTAPYATFADFDQLFQMCVRPSIFVAYVSFASVVAG